MAKASRELRERVLRVAHKGGDANLQSAFSAMEILWVLYDKVMHGIPGTDSVPQGCGEKDAAKDVFILSKGQSTLAMLAVLERKGILADEELDNFCQYDSRCSMQADRTKFHGEIVSSAGSLGHGFPMAVGLAMAKKIKQEQGTVYVLAGDGEMNEGTMWEACILADTHHLDNLCLIIDDNHSAQKMVNLDNLLPKLEAFGFHTDICNGHDLEALTCALREKCPGMPRAVIAETVRGYGSKTLMNDNSWFHRAPDETELRKLIQEVWEF